MCTQSVTCVREANKFHILSAACDVPDHPQRTYVTLQERIFITRPRARSLHHNEPYNEGLAGPRDQELASAKGFGLNFLQKAPKRASRCGTRGWHSDGGVSGGVIEGLRQRVAFTPEPRCFLPALRRPPDGTS